MVIYAKKKKTHSFTKKYRENIENDLRANKRSCVFITERYIKNQTAENEHYHETQMVENRMLQNIYFQQKLFSLETQSRRDEGRNEVSFPQ